MILVIGWALYALAVLLVLHCAYWSVMSHRGLRILIIPGPSTVLAILSVLAGAATWAMAIPVVMVDLASWFFQVVGPWPFR